MIIIMLLYYEEALSANNENMAIVKYIHIVIALSFLSISNLASAQTYYLNPLKVVASLVLL